VGGELVMQGCEKRTGTKTQVEMHLVGVGAKVVAGGNRVGCFSGAKISSWGQALGLNVSAFEFRIHD
jgi:hypothetical protein